MKKLSCTMLLFALSLNCLAENEQRHHDAHEHGTTQMNLAIDVNQVFIELESPATNIVGFEHTPKNAAQKQAVQQAMQILKQGDKLFQFNSEARCSLIEAEVDSELAHDEKHESAKHSEFEAAYTFRCKTIASIKYVDVNLFERFSNTESVQVQMITSTMQGAVKLDHHHNRIEF